MSVSSTGSSSLDKITSAYQSTDTENAETENDLGRDAFLTMMVAQLQNQDPLNPMDGTDFSAQLAQYSQLEQLINLNESMDGLASAYSQNSQEDVMGYIGKQVTGNVDTMNVNQGSVSGGFYNLGQPADVMISITDADGNTVKTLYDGQQSSGSHLVSWDGTNNAGDAVADGTYTYTVMANTGYGYSQVPSSVTGTVDGVTYQDSKPYLVVQGILLDVSSLTSVSDSIENSDTGSVDSTLSYLGKTVDSNSPLILMDDGIVSGDELTFDLESPEGAVVKIYDAYNELVRTITVPQDDTSGGDNQVAWDGLSDDGYKASDGLYYYTVQSDSGSASTSVSEEVSGIKYMNNTQYLVLGDSGRLIGVSSITGINE